MGKTLAGRIDTNKVNTPTQLLAACLILGIATETAFITGAVSVKTPDWVPGMLATAAALCPLLILLFLFRLQTRYRRELLSDEKYVELASQASRAAPRVRDLLQAANLDLSGLIEGRSIDDAATSQAELRAEVANLSEVVELLRSRDSSYGLVPAEALLEAAKGLMGEQRWAEAAQLLREYSSRVGDDWQIYFSIGVAYANSRGGRATDVEALRAYNEAIALSPAGGEPNLIARLFGYRGAIEKRLDRLHEAESDLLLAQRWASRSYEIEDITYNLACVYAKLGRRDEVLDLVRRLKGTASIRAIRAHLDDYFASMRRDPEFLGLLNASIQR